MHAWLSANPAQALVRGGEAEDVAVRDGDERLTYGQLRRRAGRIAAWLAGEGIGPGDRVALPLANGIDFVAAYAGTLAAGAVAVPLGGPADSSQLAYCLDDAHPRATICGAEVLHTAADLGIHLGGAVAIVGEGVGVPGAVRLAQVLSRPGAEERLVPRSAGSPTVIAYDQALALPRGVVLSASTIAWAGFLFGDALGLGPGKLVLAALPLSTPFGLTCVLGGALAHGATLTLARDGAPAAAGRPPDLVAVNAAAAIRLAGDGATGTGPVVADHREHDAVRGAAPDLGLRPVPGCGTGETAGLIGIADGPGADAASAGHPVWGVEVAVRGPDDAVLPAGETGDLLVRGHNVMLGYHERPTATREVIDGAGWLRTGLRGSVGETGELHLREAADHGAEARP